MAQFAIADDPTKALISFYNAPVTNVNSSRSVTLREIADYIKSNEASNTTKHLHDLKIQFDTSPSKEMKQKVKEEMRKYKAMKFAFVTFSGQFQTRTDIGILVHSSLICLDFDHLGYAKDSTKERLITDKFFKPMLLFTSPSGDGLKLVIYIDLNKADHATWFRALLNYMKDAYQLDVDPACRNLSRACFLPCDPNAHVAPEVMDPSLQSCIVAPRFHEFNPVEWAAKGEKPKQTSSSVDHHVNLYRQQEDGDTFTEARQAVDVIVSLGKDITDGYSNWLNLGFALSNMLGEQGRELYHDLSRMHPDYNYEKCDKQYTACLNGKGSGITGATFWKMMNDAGVCAKSAIVPSGITQQNTIIKEVIEENENDVPSDTMAQMAQSSCSSTFSDKLNLDDIVELLRFIFESENDAVSRDKMLLGALSVISGMLPESYFTIYDRKRVFATLYNLIVGGYATSKGDLEACRQIVMPLKLEMRRRYEAQMSDYEEQQAQWEAKSGPRDRATRGAAPKEPVLCNPFVSANSSASAVYRGMDANGGWGIIFDSEADSMSNMLSKSEYGDYTDLLRKAYHQEPCSMVRVSDHINIELIRPHLSVFLTCTGSQIPKLLTPDNVANGLASRFGTYILPPSSLEFRNVFAHNDEPIEDKYYKLGEKMLILYHALEARKDHPIQFIMSQAQEETFVATFTEILREQFDMLGEGIQGFVFRLALQCYRYAMVLTALRRLSDRINEKQLFDDDEQAITCDERDFRTAMTIMECLVNHTGRLFKVIGTQDKDPFQNCDEKPNEATSSLYKALPSDGTFKTKNVLEVAKTLNMSERTAKRILGDLVNKFQVLAHPKQGVYAKISVKKPEA